MRVVKRTIYAGDLQTAKVLGIPYTLRANTTLNEKHNIHANAVLNQGQYPSVQYVAIGRGGHQIMAGADGVPYMAPVPHRVKDAALYDQVPFVLRLETQDLSPVQRANYGLRKSVTIDGERYFAYYLKRMDLSNVVVELRQTQVRDGEETTIPFVPNNSNLNPTPPEIPPSGAIPTLTDGDYVSASALITVPFTPFDVSEFINVANIMFGGEHHAIISELVLCSGVDRQVQAEGAGGVPFNFMEVIGCQCHTFMSTYHQMAFTNEGIEFVIDAGTTEAMLTEIDTVGE